MSENTSKLSNVAEGMTVLSEQDEKNITGGHGGDLHCTEGHVFDHATQNCISVTVGIGHAGHTTSMAHSHQPASHHVGDMGTSTANPRD